MKKWITLLASTVLALSTASFAAKTNPNDVLQTIPGNNNNNTMMADADTTSSASATTGTDDSKPVKAKSKKKSKKKHGCTPAVKQN